MSQTIKEVKGVAFQFEDTSDWIFIEGGMADALLLNNDIGANAQRFYTAALSVQENEKEVKPDEPNTKPR